MKALTLWPEWAFAVHFLGKRVENRDWAIPPGWYALHAGKYIGGRPGNVAAHEGIEGLQYMGERAGWRFELPVPDKSEPPRVDREARSVGARAGHIVTSAILGAIRIDGADRPGEGDLGGWRVPDAVGNRIGRYEPCAEPVPCKGAQGLWTVPDEVVAKMRRATKDQREPVGGGAK